MGNEISLQSIVSDMLLSGGCFWVCGLEECGLIEHLPSPSTLKINKSSLGYTTQPEDGLKQAETCSCFLTVHIVQNKE
jgi:hypothetical protein